MESTSMFLEKANEIARLKELTKTTYEEAVKRTVEAANRAASFRRRAKELSALADTLGSLAYTYASEHPTALDNPLRELKDRTKASTVTFDDCSVYTLVVGLGDPKRVDGSNITEAFKSELPEGWVKTKLDLAVEAIKSASKSEREKYGLVCQPAPRWKLIEN